MKKIILKIALCAYLIPGLISCAESRELLSSAAGAAAAAATTPVEYELTFNKEEQCSFCKNKIGSQYQDNHRAICTAHSKIFLPYQPRIGFLCKICGFPTLLQKSLRDHLKAEYHLKAVYHLNKVIPAAIQAPSAAIQALNDKPVKIVDDGKCSFCGMLVNSGISTHLKSCTIKEEYTIRISQDCYQCKICQKTFSERNILPHIKIHNSKAPIFQSAAEIGSLMQMPPTTTLKLEESFNKALPNELLPSPPMSFFAPPSPQTDQEYHVKQELQEQFTDGAPAKKQRGAEEQDTKTKEEDKDDF